MLIDFHEVWSLGRRLTGLCIADLARLNTFVAATPRERQRFLLRFLKRLGVFGGKVSWQRKIDVKTQRLRRYYANQGYDFTQY